MDDSQKITQMQSAITMLQSSYKTLEQRLNTHRHIGSDLTTSLGAGSSRMYSGYMADGAAGTPFPIGWTSSKASTGNYTVTHNLGTTNYIVLLTVELNGNTTAVVNTRGSTSFNVLVLDPSANAFKNSNIAFSLIPG